MGEVIKMTDTCVMNPEQACAVKMQTDRLEARVECLERWKDSSHEFHEKFYA